MGQTAIFTARQKRLIWLSGTGGLLAFYDFMIYAMLAIYIAPNFFPSSGMVTTLVETFAAFAAGYIARPIGGFIFGHFGDRIGRKTIFTTTIFMLALSTFGIGLIPPYSVMGVGSQILLVFFLLQRYFIEGLSKTGIKG